MRGWFRAGDLPTGRFGFSLGEDYVHEELVRGFAADLYLFAEGLMVAVGLGVAGGVWCAARDRTRSARVVEGAAVLIVALSLLSDLAIARVDPRIRAAAGG